MVVAALDFFRLRRFDPSWVVWASYTLQGLLQGVRPVLEKAHTGRSPGSGEEVSGSALVGVGERGQIGDTLDRHSGEGRLVFWVQVAFFVLIRSGHTFLSQGVVVASRRWA